MKPYDQMDTDELSNEMVAKQKELMAAETQNEILELEDLRLAKEIAELSLKRKGIAPGLIQGKHSVRRIHCDLKILDKLYWKARQ